MDGVTVSVTVDDEHMSAIDEVVAELRTHGCDVTQVLDDVGIIIGTVAPERRRSLETVPGVASVTEEERVQLPPPEAPIQ